MQIVEDNGSHAPKRTVGWFARDLISAPESWHIKIPGEALAELDDFSGASPLISDPPLRGLRNTADFIGEVSSRLAYGPGIVVASGFPVEDEGRTANLLWALGRVMGRAVPQTAQGSLIGRVEDLGADFNNPHHRGHQTRAALPFHVDRTDVIALLCIRKAANGGQSLVASALTVHNILASEHPDLLDALYRPLPQDRRGEQYAGELPWCEIPVFALTDGQLIARYVRRFIESSQRHDRAPRLTPLQFAALDAVDDILSRRDVVLAMDLEPGEIQFLDNFSVLHARSSFNLAPASARRLMLRLWLSTPDSPRLPESFAPIYGATDPGTIRGGVWPPENRALIGRPVREDQ